MLQKFCDCIDETVLLSLLTCSCLHDIFSRTFLKISWLIKLTLSSFEVIIHIQLLWYRCKEFLRSTFLESFVKPRLVRSLKEGLWFMLRSVSCVCLANWLDWNWPENRRFASQFVRGMEAEEVGSQIVDGACCNYCYMVGIHMELDFFNSTVTEMISLNNAFW